MPLTEKGEKIQSAMKEQYGSEKGEQVFYASKNKGRITGVDTKSDTIAMGSMPTKADAKVRKDWEDLGPGEDPATKSEREKNEELRRSGRGGGSRDRDPEKDPKSTSQYSGWDSKGDAALKRAEAAHDEDRLLDKALAHCDALSRRMDACEEKMVARAGDRDD